MNALTKPNLKGYHLTPNAKGDVIMCSPPGPCRCGHAVALFVVRHGDVGCANCMPDAKPTQERTP